MVERVDYIGYILAFFVVCVSLKIYLESDVFNLKCIISQVDGNKYCVRETIRSQKTADLLATVTVKLTTLVGIAYKKNQSDVDIKRLHTKFNPRKIKEILPTSQYTAFSENKGEKIGIKEVFGFEALSLLKQRSFSIFLGASLLIGIPIQMYFAFFNMFLNDIGVSNVASKMSLGQVSEAAFMVFIPWMIGRVGLKWMMSLGLAFWSIRYFLFAGISVNAEYLIIFSILIHGACYDFFNVTGSIYVDLKAGERYRSAAQGLFMLVFLGLGKFFGSNLAGFISTKNPSTVDGFLYDWSGIFNTTGIITAGITVFFILSFHDKQKYDLNKDN